MLTQKRDLRTGLSPWQDSRPRGVSSDQYKAGMKADVIVVGSGISGALMADAILASGLSVIMVDRRKPLTGSTPASTCLLQSEIDTPLTHLARQVGRQQAARAWLRSADAVSALSARIADLDLDCDHEERSSLYLPGNVLDAGALKREYEMRREIGLRAEFLTAGDVRAEIGVHQPAVLTRGNAEADPVKLVAGLLRRNHERGAKLLSDFEVAHLDEAKSRVLLTAIDGRKLAARHAVFCTGYEMLKAFQPKGFKVISTWAVATKPQARRLWRGRHLIWQAADPYLYMRTTADGRVIAGGADEEFSDEAKRDALISVKSKKIARMAGRRFPQIDFTPDYRWTGSFGVSPTGLPAIGLLPSHKRSYSVMGFGGNGITFSMLAAQIIARSINGITDPDADVFKP
jgi:glycine/D-amino acid oxidase-like deaminating enzyme